MKALLEAAFFGCDEMLLRFVGLAEHFGQMLDGADEIVFFAQTAVEFHVERADRLEEPGNWIALIELFRNAAHFGDEIGRASCRERVCQYVSISVVAASLKQKPPPKHTPHPPPPPPTPHPHPPPPP